MIELLANGEHSEHESIGDALRAAALISDQHDSLDVDVTLKTWRVNKHEPHGVIILSSMRGR